VIVAASSGEGQKGFKRVWHWKILLPYYRSNCLLFSCHGLGPLSCSDAQIINHL
jgi:hypothetical protein